MPPERRQRQGNSHVVLHWWRLDALSLGYKFVKKYISFFVALFTIAACAAPTIPGDLAAETPTLPPQASPVVAAPTPVVLGAEARSEQGGFSLRYPQGWATRETSGTLAIAASADQLDGASPGASLLLEIEAAPLSALAAQHSGAVISDTRALFDLSAQGVSGAGVTISATEAISVAGRSALAADLRSDGAAGRIVALLAPPQGLRLIAQASPAAWPAQRPIFEAIVASIQLFAPPPPPTATPSPDAAAQPLILRRGTDAITTSFVLRLGGNTGARGSRFSSARGLAAAPDGTLYLAESSQGVWVFAPDGKLVRTFGKADLLDSYDVALGPNGEIFVADFGRNAIVRFNPDGKLAQRFGEAGDGPAQFGLLAPQRIAVGADGTVYALDARGANTGVASRILRFKGSDGSPFTPIPLPEGSAPNDLAVDSGGNIYLAETFGGAVVKLAPDGKVLARLGGRAASEAFTAGALDVDAQGNILVATWGSGVIKLSPTGSVLAQAGAAAAQGSIPAPGQFSLPNGIAAAGGGTVWVSDNSGEYSAVTALRLADAPQAAATAQADATAQTAATAQAVVTATTTLSTTSTWAASATATSQYDASYAPANVVGPPDAPGCSSGTGSWASHDPNGQDTLEVKFATPLFARSLNVYQNHQPGFIVGVELIDERGAATRVYTAAPRASAACPDVLRVSFPQTLLRITSARIILDQRTGASWNEIDAVELVGAK